MYVSFICKNEFISHLYIYPEYSRVKPFTLVTFKKNFILYWSIVVAQTVKNLPAMWETWV